MQTGMLGNSEALRQIWDGPLKDLLIKLNGEDGPEVLVELKKFTRREPCWVQPESGDARKVEKTKVIIPNLHATGPTLADWLKAREELLFFFTGERIVLMDIFALTPEELASTTLMPAFRPAGATNRMALLWKGKMGESDPYEEVDVMRYKNSTGGNEPELYLLNRSTEPDADTLGRHAKSPDALVLVPNKLWIGLFLWCDADILHATITGNHLELNKWCWFPHDHLPRGEVALGLSDDGRSRFYWSHAGYCYPDCGARSAKKVPLKPRT